MAKTRQKREHRQKHSAIRSSEAFKSFIKKLETRCFQNNLDILDDVQRIQFPVSQHFVCPKTPKPKEYIEAKQNFVEILKEFQQINDDYVKFLINAINTQIKSITNTTDQYTILTEVYKTETKNLQELLKRVTL